ncbi:YdcF family protein [Piscinibacter sp.]|uniref:YdcF family protein n=1 Tax=Piscinibacter sp. TaxID=1903157 RepID=UPI002C4D7073|nr:YdcF family protein [Albitalea sp.]HUG21819.1 YdcF family protein [Albitalea sp.]
MNSLFVMLGIESWKPILTALVLPPVPFLLTTLVGARLILPRRGWGWSLIVLSVAGLWLSSTAGAGRMLERFVLDVPPALQADRLDEIRGQFGSKGAMAIVVLGGGQEPFAPEYGMSNLAHRSLERLRYGLWLGRETGVPVAFSGGTGWAASGGASEAEIAARVAQQQFNRPLRWTEEQSRDTRENAARTVPLLQRAGVAHILLVTHGWHMPRAQRAFVEAASSKGITIEAAPMGLAARTEGPALDWLPTANGCVRVHHALREWLGRLAGA